ncbi:MAG TPA: FIST N-terminal domain-containing protein [Pseudonocardiaceae bacterium]
MHGDAKLLVVFCSPSCDLAELLAQIRTRSAGAPVIGDTTTGEIATSGPNEASIVVAAFGGDGFEIGTAAAKEASKDLRQAGARAARCLPSRQDRPNRVLLL